MSNNLIIQQQLQDIVEGRDALSNVNYGMNTSGVLPAEGILLIENVGDLLQNFWVGITLGGELGF